MKFLEFLRKLCPLCLVQRKSLAEEERRLAHERDTLDQISWAITQQKIAIENREEVHVKRQTTLDEFRDHLLEKEMLLEKRERDLLKERESMIGKDNMEIKAQILLPFLKQKWEAEAKKIDAERVQILQETPAVTHSLLSRKLELEARITMIKQKPSTTGNHNLLIEAQSRMKELDEIIAMLDQRRVPV